MTLYLYTLVIEYIDGVLETVVNAKWNYATKTIDIYSDDGKIEKSISFGIIKQFRRTW